MSAYISSKHAEAQHTYANRQAAGGQRPNISATGSDVDRGGRGQDDRSGQQSGQITGRSRGGRGRTNGRRARAYINNVDVTDPRPQLYSRRMGKAWYDARRRIADVQKWRPWWWPPRK